MNSAEINSIIDNICAKLQLPTEKGFEYITRIGVLDVIVCVIALIALIIFVPLSFHSFHLFQKEEDAIKAVHLLYLTVGAFICASLAALALLCNLPSLVLYLYSPEAWGMRYLIEVLMP